MSIPDPPPPTTIHTSAPITQSAAHDFLTAYLERATTDAALQPNASITEHGPESRTTAAAPNLILHNLRRVAAGLGGEVLGRDPSKDQYRDQEKNGQGQMNGEGGEWEYAKEEQMVEMEDNNGNGNEDDMNVDEGDDGEAEAVPLAGTSAGGVDKEERKRKKKERRAAEKKQRMG